MLGIDDGIWSGNLNAADIFFIVATVLLVVAAVLAFPRPAPSRASVYSTALAYLGLGCATFAWLIL